MDAARKALARAQEDGIGHTLKRSRAAGAVKLFNAILLDPETKPSKQCRERHRVAECYVSLLPILDA